MAVTLEIAWDPVAPMQGEVDDPAERATWGRFSIVVTNGASRRVLTQLEDLEAKTLGDAVYGPVIGIAEWFVRAWTHLAGSRRAEPEAGRRQIYLWRRTHSLRMAGDGLSLPGVVFRPSDDDAVAVEWCSDETVPPYARVRYVGQGSVDLPAAVVKASIAAFVNSTVARLQTLCPETPRARELARLWRLASDPADADHAAFDLAGHLGVLWTAATQEEHDRLRSAAKTTHPVLRAVVDRLSPLKPMEALDWADARWEESASQPPSPSTWEALWQRLHGSGLPGQSDTPWVAGWECAERLRRSLGIAATDRPGLEDIEQQVGLADQADPRIEPRESLIIWHAGHRAVRLRAPATGRFRRARDLFVALWGPGVQSSHAVLYSPLVVGSASVANAFAAEWLAPAARVRAALGARTVIDEDDLLELAQAVDAPAACVRHQIENRRLARVTFDM